MIPTASSRPKSFEQRAAALVFEGGLARREPEIARQRDHETVAQAVDDAALEKRVLLRLRAQQRAEIAEIEALLDDLKLKKGRKGVTTPLRSFKAKSKWGNNTTRPNGTILEILRQHRVAVALRAMAARCFSPPESLSPRSPTLVS